MREYILDFWSVKWKITGKELRNMTRGLRKSKSQLFYDNLRSYINIIFKHPIKKLKNKVIWYNPINFYMYTYFDLQSFNSFHKSVPKFGTELLQRV